MIDKARVHNGDIKISKIGRFYLTEILITV